MNQNFQIILPNAAATEKFGENLAKEILAGVVIFLQGNLGAGKTTLVRGILRGLGYGGHVKSPTYTLVEPYQINQQQIFHFDLYRVNDPEELIHIGIQDYCHAESICIIEWPEKALAMLPMADLEIEMQVENEGRSLQIKANSELGLEIIKKL